jgi:type II restriction/modification system DNA methylase subunit YeeA
MTPAQFIGKWSDSELRERQAAQEHFLDLCALLGEPTPAEDDPKGDHYCFERGAEKVGGGEGWADVWRKGCFGWEYKGKHKDLGAALRQLQAYALDLENPPYLVVSDMERIVAHTNWTNTVSRKIEFTFDDLRDPRRLEELRLIFRGSDRLKPTLNPQDITAKAAARFGELGRRLQERGHHPRAVAHFLNRLVFCMFAEDARLLPAGLFTRTIKATMNNPKAAQRQLAELFGKMAQPEPGQRFFGADFISWFNGGLFENDATLPLEEADLKLIVDTASEHDWSEIDPAIFGTLFEQALKATRERPALGAHYTDREKILKIVEPVIVRPLTAEWEAAKAEIAAAMERAKAAEAERRRIDAAGTELLKLSAEEFKRTNPQRNKARTAALKARNAATAEAREKLEAFLARLAAFRVLDPACGSGNFLYVALHALKDLELRAIVDADRLGVPDVPPPRVGLDAVRGIEIEEYAAELARVTLWIGDLQWMRKNGYTNWQEPILSSLDQIECRDALLTRVEQSVDARHEAGHDGEGGGWAEAEWPKADAIIGNPPFLGGKRMRSGLGDDYVERLFAVYDGRVPAEADFVCYWVEKAWRAIEGDRAQRAGLVTTNSIRGGANRRALESDCRSRGDPRGLGRRALGARRCRRARFDGRVWQRLCRNAA